MRPAFLWYFGNFHFRRNKEELDTCKSKSKPGIQRAGFVPALSPSRKFLDLGFVLFQQVAKARYSPLSMRSFTLDLSGLWESIFFFGFLTCIWDTPMTHARFINLAQRARVIGKEPAVVSALPEWFLACVTQSRVFMRWLCGSQHPVFCSCILWFLSTDRLIRLPHKHQRKATCFVKFLFG